MIQIKLGIFVEIAITLNTILVIFDIFFILFQVGNGLHSLRCMYRSIGYSEGASSWLSIRDSKRILYDVRIGQTKHIEKEKAIKTE